MKNHHFRRMGAGLVGILVHLQEEKDFKVSPNQHTESVYLVFDQQRECEVQMRMSLVDAMQPS